MITSKEREEAFISALKMFLEARGAELEVTDDGKDYGMHSGVCRISMDAIYNEMGNIAKEYCEFDLPSYMP